MAFSSGLEKEKTTTCLNYFCKHEIKETPIMLVICLDLEGVLVPEIWIAFAEKTGIKKLRLTTRDIPDYD